MISNHITGIDTTGPISKRINLANEKNLTPSKMISIVSKGEEGLDEYFETKKEKPIQERQSMLDEFQL